MAASAGDRPPPRVLFGVGTTRTVRAHWALVEVGLSYRTEPVQTRTGATETPAFTALNPRGKIPVLVDEGVAIAESPAIVTHLAERYGSRATLWMPEDGATRARYFEWLSFIAMELDATSLYVLRRHEYLPEIYGDAPAAIAAAKAYFARMIAAAATMLPTTAEPACLLGESFSGVDILMATTLDWALAYRLPLPPPLIAYRERVAARPAYARALDANRLP